MQMWLDHTCKKVATAHKCTGQEHCNSTSAYMPDTFEAHTLPKLTQHQMWLQTAALQMHCTVLITMWREFKLLSDHCCNQSPAVIYQKLGLVVLDLRRWHQCCLVMPTHQDTVQNSLTLPVCWELALLKLLTPCKLEYSTLLFKSWKYG